MASKRKLSADAGELDRLAYHAAGHAVACDELGIYYEQVSIAGPCHRMAAADDGEELTFSRRGVTPLLEAC